jgi:hypothetical protein
MPSFLLILRDDPKSWAKYSPEEMQKIFERYFAWGTRMREQKRVLDGHKLKDEGGKSVRKESAGGRKSLRVVDGPYAETKDVIGGYYLIRADSYAEVMKLIEDHPHLDLGHTIDVRQIDPVGPDDPES